MANEAIIADLRKSIETWDFKLAQSATQQAIDAGMSVGEIIGDGLGKGMETIGVRFDKAEIYLPQVVAASKAMEAALGVLKPLMEAGSGSLKGTVIMGTVEGDMNSERTCAAPCSGVPVTTSSTLDPMCPRWTSWTPQRRTTPRSAEDPRS